MKCLLASCLAVVLALPLQMPAHAFIPASEVSRDNSNPFKETLIQPYSTQTPGNKVMLLEDFDGDGDKDVVTMAGSGFYKVELHYNNGKGEFEESVLTDYFPKQAAPLDGLLNGVLFDKWTYFSADTHDFNTDGYLDILVTHAQGKVEILFGTPEGIFRQGVTLIQGEHSEGTPAKVMNLDGDEFQDVVAIRYEGSSIPYLEVFYGTENGLEVSPEKRRINYRSYMKNLRAKFTEEIRKKCLDEKSGTGREEECDRPPENEQITPLTRPYLNQIASIDMLLPLEFYVDGSQQLVVAGNNSLITMENNHGDITLKHIEMIGRTTFKKGEPHFRKQIVSAITTSHPKAGERPYIVAGVYGRTPSFYAFYWNHDLQNYSDGLTWLGNDNAEAIALSQLYGEESEELITASFHTSEVGVFHNNRVNDPEKPFGEGHFTLRQADIQSTGARALKVEDIDADGRPEVLVLRQVMGFSGTLTPSLTSKPDGPGFEVVRLLPY